MVKVSNTETVEVPDGPLCANWGYRTYMAPEQNYKCPMLRITYDHISDRDAISSGLGYSGGTLTHAECLLFHTGLRTENGVGPFKCEQCKKQSLPEK